MADNTTEKKTVAKTPAAKTPAAKTPAAIRLTERNTHISHEEISLMKNYSQTEPISFMR